MDNILKGGTDMRRSMIYNVMTVSALIALSLSSCVKKEIYRTPHPDKGAVVLAPDWSEALSEADIPATWSYCVNESDAYYAESRTHCHPDPLPPGTHTLLVYNEPQGITLDGHTAAVNTTADGLLIALPEYLYSATRELAVIRDDTTHVSIGMKRLLIPLSMRVSIDREYADKLADIKASLSGVSGTVELDTWQIGEDHRSVMLDAALVEETSRSGSEKKIELRCRIIGICSDCDQKLTITLTDKDGNVNTVTSDLSDELEDINTSKDPVDLDGGSLSSPSLDGSFNGTIDNWEEVSGGDVDAN